MSNAFLVTLFQHKAWCNRSLVEALRAAPADVDRRQWAVILFTLDHTAIVDRIFRARLAGEPQAETAIVAGRMPDLEGLAGAMAETDAWYLDYVARASPQELETVVEFAFVDDGAAGRMTKGEMLAHVVTHGASHRGAIGKMLEGLQVRGASDMVTSFVRETAAAEA
ncbi:MAG TPA: DinB family protein [Caulobacteraceae bacterium]|nr:DinB family protein [Caulobacteraceae bacterium]